MDFEIEESEHPENKFHDLNAMERDFLYVLFDGNPKSTNDIRDAVLENSTDGCKGSAARTVLNRLEKNFLVETTGEQPTCKQSAPEYVITEKGKEVIDERTMWELELMKQ